MMTTNSAQHSHFSRARTLRARGPAVAGAAAATTAVRTLASPLAGLDVRMDPGHAAQHMGPVTAAVTTVVAGLSGQALLTAFERPAARPPRRSWTITAVAVLVVSLAGPLGAGTTTSTKVALACMHLAAAAC
jgi:hypothetical protein